MSTWSGSALPPAFSISSAAVKMVPGSLGCGSTVLAAITILAPSRAARSAIARPMPRDPPVMKTVLPFRVVIARFLLAGEAWRALLGEGGDALGEVARGRAVGELARLGGELRLERV